MIDYRHYTYRVTWSEEDNEYVALCAEFPSLSYLSETHADALSNMLELIKDTVEDMTENNEPVPEPIADKDFSGKFMVRIPPAQHKNLVIQATEQGISLNRYVSSKLI